TVALDFSLRHALLLSLTPLLLIVATFYLAGSVSKGQFPEQDTGLIWGRASSSATVSFQEMAERQRRLSDTFLADLGLTEPGLNRVINAAYSLLGLQTYFTAGVKEVRAWTVRKGATAPQAAAVIHTDFEKGFIRAETIAYDDFIKYKGEAGAKEAGRLRLEGKEYRVQEGDILHFRFNV
ncbi:MAG: DUF933 domain-containing protein, partial [Stenotrophomonas sp.]